MNSYLSFIALLAVSCLSFTLFSDSYRLGMIESGQASYYAKRFHGATTASGERFNMHAYTAAHKYLPFGSLVSVTNRKNNKKVVLRINDRGPFIEGRIVDVSYQAAKTLDMVRDGLADVDMQILRIGEKGAIWKGDKTKESSEAAKPLAKEEKADELERPQKRIIVYSPRGQKVQPDGYTVQVGGFRSLSNAKRKAQRLAREHEEEVFLEVERLEARQYLIRVLVGRLAQKEALKLSKKLRRRGYKASFARPHDLERQQLKAAF